MLMGGGGGVGRMRILWQVALIGVGGKGSAVIWLGRRQSTGVCVSRAQTHASDYNGRFVRRVGGKGRATHQHSVPVIRFTNTNGG